MEWDKYFAKDYVHVDIIYLLSNPFLWPMPHKTGNDKTRHIFNRNQVIQEANSQC